MTNMKIKIFSNFTLNNYDNEINNKLTKFKNIYELYRDHSDIKHVKKFIWSSSNQWLSISNVGQWDMGSIKSSNQTSDS